jgi:murein DD-endopeptidase MepM/ murein hydrolase activator NlpD
MAIGDPAPAWPLPHDARPRSIRASRRFGASRVDRKTGLPRYHAAIDLGSAHGHPVVAPEAGVVAKLQTFLGPENHALLLQTDTGPVLLLGELDPTSWRVAEGERVVKGQWVGNVGTTNLLHFGAFTKGTRATSQWFVGDPPPPSLLDPTAYVDAMLATPAPSPTPPAPMPAPSPSPTPSPGPPVGAGDGAPLLALLLVGLAWGWEQ